MQVCVAQPIVCDLQATHQHKHTHKHKPARVRCGQGVTATHHVCHQLPAGTAATCGGHHLSLRPRLRHQLLACATGSQLARDTTCLLSRVTGSQLVRCLSPWALRHRLPACSPTQLAGREAPHTLISTSFGSRGPASYSHSLNSSPGFCTAMPLRAAAVLTYRAWRGCRCHAACGEVCRRECGQSSGCAEQGQLLQLPAS